MGSGEDNVKYRGSKGERGKHRGCGFRWQNRTTAGFVEGAKLCATVLKIACAVAVLRQSWNRLRLDRSIVAQATKPKPVIPLSKVRIEEPAFDEPDPALIIVDKVTKKEYMFRSENEGDKQQLQLLYNICKEISQGNNHFPAAPAYTPMPNSLQARLDIPATSAIIPQSTSEDEELAMAISASIQSALAEGIHDVNLTSTRISAEPQLYESSAETPSVAQFPSAPPMVEETIYRASSQYPSRAEANEGSSISCPIDLTVNASETKSATSEGASLSGLCVVCLDARVEGACIPCGHMAGCMSCLLEIKAKNWGCPVCRANIYQVIKLYAV